MTGSPASCAASIAFVQRVRGQEASRVSNLPAAQGEPGYQGGDNKVEPLGDSAIYYACASLPRGQGFRREGLRIGPAGRDVVMQRRRRWRQ
jgi:hypothetical protein